MSRAANAVDFWRGFALVEIFVNHVPGNFWEQFTHKVVSQSDSAELFVFLAGWSLKHVVGPPEDPRPTDRLTMRLFLRAGKLYAAHMVLVMAAIAMLATASKVLDNPLLLEWFNASAVFTVPVETHIGLVVLTHQLGYFDILPLYVVLLFASPFVALLHRRWPSMLLPVSAGIWLTCLIGQFTFSTWPMEGEWFFDPLCWQFDFVLGFLLAYATGLGGWVRAHIKEIRWLAIPVVIVAAWLRFAGYELDPTTAPEPHLLFVNDKSFLTPTRIGQFLLLAAAVSPLWGVISRSVPTMAEALSLLGRNSLLVFCIGSLLSLCAQILRFAFRSGPIWDTAIIACGLAMLFTAARIADWWEHQR